jgi:GNAT superfamily N-acetyltransferase
MRGVRISYLIEHPEYISQLAQWLFEQWDSILGEETPEARIKKLKTHMNRDKLPIAWVAHANGQLLGSAALRVHDLEGREDLTPWLGGVFVGSHFRRQGIGAALCTTVEDKARSRGIQTLYLFTLNLLTKVWAAEYGPSGVRVNVVSPGPTRTEGTDAMGEGLEQLAAQAQAGRPATADEIAEAIVFLATDRASFIYGAKLAVDGGRTAI